MKTRQATVRFIDQPIALVFNFSTVEELATRLAADLDYQRAPHVTIDIRDVAVAARPDWLPPDHSEPVY